MIEIDKRYEAPGRGDHYTDDVATRHRAWVGGKWETMGVLQRDFLVGQGLEPGHRLVDIGCGSLRAGHLLVDYLEPGNYYGIDANLSVLEAGYSHELSADQQARLPAANLRATDRFDVDFGVTFDVALAQSVFTHVSLNHIRLCMVRLARVMAPGGRFFATFWEQAPSVEVDAVIGKNPKRNMHTERNPFWYYRSDMRWASTWGDWEFEYLGRWGHPRGQRMVIFTKR